MRLRLSADRFNQHISRGLLIFDVLIDMPQFIFLNCTTTAEGYFVWKGLSKVNFLIKERH